IMKEFGVPATFFSAGQAMERNLPLTDQVLSQGHEIAGRGYRLLPYYSLSEAGERDDINRAIETIRHITGKAPLGWRSRAPSERTRHLLLDAGCFTYDSDFSGDDLPVLAALSPAYVKIPYSVETSDMSYWAMSGTSG